MSKLAKGIILVAIGVIYKIILTLIIDKFLAVQLGVENFGQYKYGITIVLLLSTFCTLGMGTSIIRTIAIQNSFEKKKKIISVSLFFVFIASALVLIISLSQKTFFLIDFNFLLATLFFSLNSLFGSIYSGLEKPTLKVWINDIFGFTIYLFFLWAFFKFNGETEQISIVYLIYVFTVFVVNIISSKKFYAKFNKDYILSKEFKDYSQYSVPLFWVSVLIILSANLDKLLLNFFVSEKQLGIYYAVFNISNLLSLILTVLVFLYLPIMSRLIKAGKQKKAELLSSYSSKWTMVLASILFWFIISYTEEILMLLYSNEFVEGVFVLKTLALSQWINVSLGFTGQNLLALGDSKSQLYIRTMSFFLGIILLFFGVKYYGNVGAAFSILIALIFSNVLQIIVLKRKHNFVGYGKQNLITLIVVLSIAILLLFVHKIKGLEHLNFLVLAFIDIFLFMLILFISKVIGKKDIRVLKIV